MPEINYFNQNDNGEFQFILADAGTDVKVNGQPKRVLITNTGLDTKYDDKKISSLEQVGCGDLIEFLNRKWLVVSEVNGLRYDHYKAIMRCCDFNVKFNINCKVYEFPCIIESNKNTVQNGSTMIIPSGMIMITLQDNVDTQKIKRDQRIIKFSKAWIVRGHDFSQKGLITLYCEEVQISASDDLVNEIADKCTKTYVVEILNGASSNVDVNGTLQLNMRVTENGAVVTMPVTYESSDTTIATVSASGVVSGLNQGTVTITARLQEDTNIFDTITIEVKPLVVLDNYSVSISGKTDISYGMTSTYTAQILNNGVATTGKAVTWSIKNEDGTTTPYGTIKSFTDTTCVVQIANNQNYIGKYVVLTAKLSTDASVFADYRIKAKGLF